MKTNLGGCGDNWVAEYVTILNRASENSGLHMMIRVQECCRRHAKRHCNSFVCNENAGNRTDRHQVTVAKFHSYR